MTVISVSRVDKNRVTSAYQALVRSLNLEVAPPEPDVYVSTAAGKLDAPWEVEQLARQLLRSELSYCVGKSPHTLAPAAVYAAAQLHDGSYTTTQSQAAATTGTSTVSVRTRAHELLSLAGHNSAEVIRS